jgi:hypothetical protein
MTIENDYIRIYTLDVIFRNRTLFYTIVILLNYCLFSSLFTTLFDSNKLQDAVLSFMIIILHAIPTAFMNIMSDIFHKYKTVFAPLFSSKEYIQYFMIFYSLLNILSFLITVVCKIYQEIYYKSSNILNLIVNIINIVFSLSIFITCICLYSCKITYDVTTIPNNLIRVYNRYLRINNHLQNNVRESIHINIESSEPPSRIRINESNIPDELCSICLTELKSISNDDYVIKTRCNHYFHYICLTELLNHNNKCPICRRRIN